jgi:hypothetical protein
MTTVVNNPATPATTDNSGVTGLIVGLIVVAFLAFLFFFYGLPAFRNATQKAPTNVDVEVPKDINVEVNPNQ